MGSGMFWIVIGTVLMVAFVYVNFVVVKQRFPENMAIAAGDRQAHRLTGLAELGLFTLAVTLIAVGFVIIGTSHPNA